MDIVWFLLIGLIAGWIAGEITKGSGFGIIGDIVVGIVGSLVGGFIFSGLGIAAYGTLGNIIMAIIGALVFLFVLRLLTGHRHGRHPTL